MKIVLSCCTKPAKFTHNAGVTLFKGEKPEVETKAQIQPQQQPVADTVVISKPAKEVEVSKK